MIRKNQLRKAFATAAVAFSSIALTTPAYAWEYNPLTSSMRTPKFIRE